MKLTFWIEDKGDPSVGLWGWHDTVDVILREGMTEVWEDEEIRKDMTKRLEEVLTEFSGDGKATLYAIDDVVLEDEWGWCMDDEDDIDPDAPFNQSLIKLMKEGGTLDPWMMDEPELDIAWRYVSQGKLMVNSDGAFTAPTKG